MHAEHAIGRFSHGGFTRACRVMAADYEVLGCASGSHHCFCFLLCLHRLIHREVPVAVSIE